MSGVKGEDEFIHKIKSVSEGKMKDAADFFKRKRFRFGQIKFGLLLS